MLLFGLFMAVLGHNPLEVYRLIWQGGFASGFSWQNTLTRAAPIILTGFGNQTNDPFYLAGGTYRSTWAAWGEKV